MKTSKVTNQNHIQQTLFAGDFLAKTSARPDCRPVSPKKLGQACFSSSCESFDWFDQNTLSWKTSQRSFLTGWESYLESWPRQGIALNGVASERVIWEVPIRETGFFQFPMLPTPTARDYKDSGPNMNYKKAAQKGRLAGVLVESRSNQTGEDTYLNPQFLEEMMSYPIGYTEVNE